MKKTVSLLLAAAIAAGTVPMSGITYAQTDEQALPTPISSDEKSDFKKLKPVLECTDKYSYGWCTLEWEPVSGALYYNVYKKSNGDKEYKLIKSTLDTAYSDEITETSYYRVKAVTFTYDDEQVESDYSNNVRVRCSKREQIVYDDYADYCETEEAYSANDIAYAFTGSTSYYPMPEINTEEYSDAEESGWKSASTDPVSTFSADVDTASYANLRRIIKSGENVPSDAVRIEEMLNYFDYNYVQPKGISPFSLTYELCDCPWNDSARLLMIGVQGKDIAEEETPDSNLVFLVDVSGSMNSNDKLPLVIDSINTLMETMSENDRVSIVTYSGYERTILAGARGNQSKTVKAVTGLLEANGSTNGEGGINAAYELAEKYYIEGGNNRIILASDGDLNVGISDTDELVKLIEKKRESGIYLTTLGFGAGNLKDEKMEALADNGNGSYHYIDCADEAEKVLCEERNSTLYTIAKDVKLQLEFNPENVKSYRLIGYDNRRLENEDFENDEKDAGDVGAGHSVTVLYEIIPNDGRTSGKLKYQKTTGENSDEWCTLKVRYKRPNESKSKQISAVIKGSLYSPMDTMSERMRFACAVTELGLILKDSEYKGTSSLSDIKSLLSDTGDSIGYSDDFKELVRIYEESGERYCD